MAEIPREERLLNLLAALLAAPGPLPFSAILGTVAGYDDPARREAVEKRFDRDKADLRALGVPLEYVAEDEFGRSGYRIARDRFFLREIRFTVEEGIVLAALQRALPEGVEDVGTATLRSALAKISVDSPISPALRDSVAEQQLLDPRLPEEGPGGASPLPALGRALAARRPVRFTYYSLGRGETAVRTVEPYGIGYFRGHWYLVGRDVEKDAERVFRTGRIRGPVEILPESPYEIPEGFHLRERVGVAPWELPSGPRIEARVRFAPEVAWMIGDHLRPGQSFEAAPDGSGVLVLSATDPEALVRWVARYGPDAEILEPESLRERMRAHLAGLLREGGG